MCLIVRSDISRAQPLAAAAVSACRGLAESWSAYSYELRCLGEELGKWRALEPPSSVEHALLGSAVERFGDINQAEEGVGTALHTALLEPLEFLHGDCVLAARECVDATLRRHPPASFVPQRPYTSSTTAPGSEGPGEVRRYQEGVAAAVQAAAGWDGSCRVRGAMTVHHLLRAANDMAELVSACT